MKGGFAIHVAKENFKFSAAHFIAYPGFREPLHGHNYQVGVRIEGRLSGVGYVLDFGLVKELMREIVARLDERTLVPTQSNCLRIEEPDGKSIRIRYGDEDFLFPKNDVRLLPISHTSAEELAVFIWRELHAALRKRGALSEIMAIEISVAEAPGQVAMYRHAIGRE